MSRAASYFSSLFVVLFSCTFLNFYQLPQALAEPANLAVAAGEIRFDGTVISADAATSTLVINVASFTLPSGKSSKLAAPKPKTVVLDGGKIVAQNDAGRAVGWELLQPGTNVVVIGKDAGSGKDVPGRLVAVALPDGMAQAGAPSTPAAQGEANAGANSNGADDDGAPKIRAGETRYDGKITGVLSASTFTVSVLATTDAAGESSELFEPQSKTVQVDAATLLRSRDDASRTLKMSDLKIGLRVTLVGKDATSKTIKAREVAVWDDESGKSRSLGTVTINQKTGAQITRGDEARDARAYEEAIKAYNQGLRDAMDEDDAAGQGMSHDRLALLYEDLEQPKRALESYQKALAIWKRLGNSNSEATTLLNLSGYYQRQDDVKSARDAIENAIRLYGTGNTRALAIAYSRLGTIQAQQDELDNAIASWQQSLNLSRQSQEHDEEILVLGRLALAYAQTKQVEKAQQAIDQLTPLLPQMNDKDEQASANYSIALSYRIMGQKDKAIAAFSQAKSLWEAAGQRDNATLAQKQLDLLAGNAGAANVAVGDGAPAGAIVPDN